MGISNCLAGNPGDVAPTVLLLQNPVEVKACAQHFLSDAFCYNEIRGMLGYTGTYKGSRISIQGVGVGVPSLCIYLYDLIHDHNARTFVGIGFSQALSPALCPGDPLLALSVSYDNMIGLSEFGPMTFAPTADFPLLSCIYDAFAAKGKTPFVGNVLTTDSYYHGEEREEKWAPLGVLGCEMNTAGLYSYAAKFGVQAVSLLGVSQSAAGEELSPEEQSRMLNDMVETVLDLSL